MNGSQIQQEDQLYIANTYGRADLVLKNGKGSLLWYRGDGVRNRRR
jgi:hypothetical protein